MAGNANLNKISYRQKVIMAEFMERHPNLARNLISPYGEGRATADSLWLELSVKLNKIGPPCKDVKMWKKVFADQKYQAKKKLSFNKILKEQKRPIADMFYEQKRISNADKLILIASGLEVEEPFQEYVKGINDDNVESQSKTEVAVSESRTIEIKIERNDSIESLASDVNEVYDVDVAEEDKTDDASIIFKQEVNEEDNSVEMNLTQSDGETTHNVADNSDNTKRKLAPVELMEENFIHDNKKQKRTHHKHKTNQPQDKEPNAMHNVVESTQMEFQQRIEAKVDRLLDIQERMLKIQEEKHKSEISLNLLKLKMKTLQYEQLKQEFLNRNQLVDILGE